MAIRELVELAARVTDMERRMASVMRHGTVAEVDPGTQRVRINFGPAHGGEGDFLSPLQRLCGCRAAGFRAS